MSCRSPHGERGLKWRVSEYMLPASGSLPTRGAWIEIVFSLTACETSGVAPHTGSVD